MCEIYYRPRDSGDWTQWSAPIPSDDDGTECRAKNVTKADWRYVPVSGLQMFMATRVRSQALKSQSEGPTLSRGCAELFTALRTSHARPAARNKTRNQEPAKSVDAWGMNMSHSESPSIFLRESVTICFPRPFPHVPSGRSRGSRRPCCRRAKLCRMQGHRYHHMYLPTT